MSSSAQATKNSITLKGSAQIVCEYLNYSINSILFQRGLYPPETFECAQKYGLTILMSKDDKIEIFLKDVLKQVEEWMASNVIEKISLVISNAHTKEALESWDFKVQNEQGDSTDTSDPKNPISTKEMKRIQQEIRDVMRQISASISYLPLLDCICSFDLHIETKSDCDIPDAWDETKAAQIHDPQLVQLRSFSTGLHKMDTVVNYKMNS